MVSGKGLQAMAVIKDKAQVLSLIEQGNTSLVAVFFGRTLGQFHVHLKGGRRWPKKGFEGGWDLLARGEVLVYPRPGDRLWLLKEWSEEARPRLGKTVPMLYAASFLSELTLVLSHHTAGAREMSNGDATSDKETARLYDLLAASADACAAGARLGPVILAFALRALENEGFLPSLNVCETCEKNLLKMSGTVWLSSEGVRCSNCAQAASRGANGKQPDGWLRRSGPAAVPLAPDALRAMLHVQATGRPVSLSSKGADQLARALVVLIHGALERDLRTLPAAVRMIRAMGKSMQATKARRGE